MNEMKKWSLYLNLVEASYHERVNSTLDISSVDNVVVEEDVEELLESGIDMTDAQRSIREILSDFVVESLLEPMADVGVYCLAHAGFFAPLSDNPQSARELAKGKKGSFFFTPVMLREKKPSFMNSESGFEFPTDSQGKKYYNKAFWKGSQATKRIGGTNQNFHTLELGAIIPEWSILTAEMDEHKNAMEWMRDNGPVLYNQKMLFLSLKGSYVHVFLKIVESQMYAAARLAGFQPLFLIKNVMVQYNKDYGVNRHQISTSDLSPKSYLVLAGFYKGQGEKLELITLTNSRNKFMAIQSAGRVG